MLLIKVGLALLAEQSQKKKRGIQSVVRNLLVVRKMLLLDDNNFRTRYEQ